MEGKQKYSSPRDAKLSPMGHKSVLPSSRERGGVAKFYDLDVRSTQRQLVILDALNRFYILLFFLSFFSFVKKGRVTSVGFDTAAVWAVGVDTPTARQA